MALLAREASATSKDPNRSDAVFPLVLTTTTKLQRPCPVAAGTIHVGDRAPPSPLFSTNGSLPILWVGAESENGKKWLAPPVSVINRFIRSTRSRVVIESDGAAERALKAPGEHEPVIPDAVGTVVAVMGMSAWGLRANPDSVHRLPAFLSITGLNEGNHITEDVLVRLARHPQGSFKGAESKNGNTVRRILLINQADSPEQIRTAEGLAQKILAAETGTSGAGPSIEPLIHTIIIASLRKKHPIHRILNAWPNT
jgi:probable selenium-dependent hydroxylase accessory protein YqeC